MKYELQSTEQFDKWFSKLKDASVRVKVLARLNRIETVTLETLSKSARTCSNCGFSSGSGLRIYYTVKANTVVLILTGGNKSSQGRDIERAAQILQTLED